MNLWFDSDDDSDDIEDFDLLGIIFSTSSSSSSSSDNEPPRNREVAQNSDHNKTAASPLTWAKQESLLFYSYSRMSLSEFEELLLMVGPMLQADTFIKESMTPTIRLAITLRYKIINLNASIQII